MGRGRAKAKQTKVARELKYSSGDLDINALTAELSGSPSDESDDDSGDDLGYAGSDALDEGSSRR